MVVGLIGEGQGIHPGEAAGLAQNFREGPWYADPPDAPNPCCKLREVATEFACRGEGSTFLFVCWGMSFCGRLAAGEACLSPGQERAIPISCG